MPDFSHLIIAVYQHGCYRPEGREAITALVNGGAPAFTAYLTMRKDPPPSDVPSRDLYETHIEILGRFSKEIPDEVIDRFEAGELGEFETYWALALGTGERSIDVLIAGLKSEDKFCRWAAAESSIQRRSRRATPALIAGLRDRSSDVKFAVVHAMVKRKDLRRPEALPALRRIVASQAIRQHSLGLHKAAEEVIRLIELETKKSKA
jgi:HEAT repeat protein